MVSLLERGQSDHVSTPVTRRIFEALEADLVIFVRWRAGDLDRLLDERHAGLGDVLARRLADEGWEVAPEITFSIYGERGSIDLLAWHPRTRTLLVIELKTELTSVEETLRRHDVKVRLAPGIVLARFGWRAASVARLLVLPETSTARRQVARHAALFHRAYPARNRAVRAFLRDPVVRSGFGGGLLFLSSSDYASAMRLAGPRKRVRPPCRDRLRA